MSRRTLSIRRLSVRSGVMLAAAAGLVLPLMSPQAQTVSKESPAEMPTTVPSCSPQSPCDLNMVRNFKFWDQEAPKQAQPLSTTYRPDPAVHRQVEAMIVNELTKQQPDKAAQVIAIFQKYDVIAYFDKAVAPWGLHSGDVAQIYSAFWLDSWVVAMDYRGKISRSQAQAVLAEVMTKMNTATVPAFQTEQGRQFFAEALIYEAVVRNALLLHAKKLHQLAAIKEIRAKAMTSVPGMNQAQFVLTDKGFIRR